MLNLKLVIAVSIVGSDWLILNIYSICIDLYLIKIQI